jgi:AsmA protein
MHAVTPHPPQGFEGPGVLDGDITWKPDASQPWTGQLILSGELLQLPGGDSQPLALPDIVLHSAEAATASASRRTAPQSTQAAPSGFALDPVALQLAPHQTLEISGDGNAAGYAVTLAGTALRDRILALASVIPQLGDGLADALPQEAPAAGKAAVAKQGEAAPASAPIHIDLTATRHWAQPQVWSGGAPVTAHPGR